MHISVKKAAITAALLATLCLPAGAQILATSTFDAGAEGWTVGEFLSASGSSAPTFVASGGNPGGFIRTADIIGFNAYHAPAAFLGNKSAAYGGTIHLEQQVLSSDGISQAMVILSDGSLLLQFRTAPPGTSWTPYDIPLLASAGWELVTDGVDPGPAATEAQLQQVLSSLTFLHVDADWQTGVEQVDLDNFRMSAPQAPSGAVPEPGTWALLASGLLPLIGMVTRRRFKA